MKWMNFAGDGRVRLRPFAGLYMRTLGRTRFWGWGEPPVSGTSPANAPERPLAGLGDWLRAAHALFDSDQPQQRHMDARAPSFASHETASPPLNDGRRKGWEKRRRLRFVCNRHVIGFVFD